MRYLSATASPSGHARFGNSGQAILALDSLDVGTNSVISVSENLSILLGAWGYVHFVEAIP